MFLLELHRATGDRAWLEAAKPHLALLELFNGRQPDHHLHDVAIPHWDGYWCLSGEVNGQKARLYDPYANDQDWALVHALQLWEG